MVYNLDDILIYSRTVEEHEEHVKQVMAKLLEFELLCKAEKCVSSAREVGFLGFVISPHGVGMEVHRIATIEDWPTLKAVRDDQVLLGFTNFNW